MNPRPTAGLHGVTVAWVPGMPKVPPRRRPKAQPEVNTVEERRQRTLAALRRLGTWANSREVSEHVGIYADRVRDYLNELAKQGLVERRRPSSRVEFRAVQ